MKKIKLYLISRLIDFHTWFKTLSPRTKSVLNNVVISIDYSFRFLTLLSLSALIQRLLSTSSLEQLKATTIFFLFSAFLPLVVYIVFGGYFRGKMNGYIEAQTITKKLTAESEAYIMQQLDGERELIADEISRKLVSQLQEAIPGAKIKIRPGGQKIYET